ncbi:MAG: response regulator, partial [Chthoniobacterales bacterium]|nr:response regulator [Chthoniobacterales bacterium]
MFRITKDVKTSSDGDKILVVDDDSMSRRLLVRTLTAAGFNCGESPDGLHALETVHRDPPSLLLLDFDMPGLDGGEVLKRLRA